MFGDIRLATDDALSTLAPSAVEMAAFDARTIAQGYTGMELMQRAGSAVAQQIRRHYPAVRTVSIVCGSGNNGGDGLVIARELRSQGIQVAVIVVHAERYSAECAQQRLKTDDVNTFCGGREGIKALTKSLEGSEIIVDAILGTGQREAPRGLIGELVQAVHDWCVVNPECQVVAVDIPTGLNADTGGVFTPHIRAHRTISIELVKRGMLQFPGRSICGDIETVSIGISHSGPCEYEFVRGAHLPRMVPRTPEVHKGALGRVLVIGGSLLMPGAPMLSALGALRAGAGIVTRLVRGESYNIPSLPEAMFEVVRGAGDFFGTADSAAVVEMARRYDVVVLGPGLGVHQDTGCFLGAVLDALRGTEISLVLDADALNLISGGGIRTSGLKSVITPHPGEAARLLGCDIAKVQSDRFAAVAQLARQFDAVALLKGPGTIVHDGEKGRIIAEGTPYLATPGSGDVLAGVIAACAFTTSSLLDAATIGAWVHAKAGVCAAQRNGGAILASEIAAEVPRFMRAVQG